MSKPSLATKIKAAIATFDFFLGTAYLLLLALVVLPWGINSSQDRAEWRTTEHQQAMTTPTASVEQRRESRAVLTAAQSHVEELCGSDTAITFRHKVSDTWNRGAGDVRSAGQVHRRQAAPVDSGGLWSGPVILKEESDVVRRSGPQVVQDLMQEALDSCQTPVGAPLQTPTIVG